MRDQPEFVWVVLVKSGPEKSRWSTWDFHRSMSQAEAKVEALRIGPFTNKYLFKITKFQNTDWM